METQDLKSGLVKILKRRDKAWFVAAASSLSKPPDELTYSDLELVPFGEFTAGRAEVDVEFLFGVCLPLSVHKEKWTTEQYFNYLIERSKKTNVNLRLAQIRTDPPGIKTTIKVVFASVFVLSLPILLFVLWKLFYPIEVISVILALMIPTIITVDYLLTHSHYLRLARRIEEVRE